jgi:hypothetical protein
LEKEFPVVPRASPDEQPQAIEDTVEAVQRKGELSRYSHKQLVPMGIIRCIHTERKR